MHNESTASQDSLLAPTTDLVEWARLIDAHFYTDDNEGSPVYLDPEDDFFDALSPQSELSFEPTRAHLIKSVRDALILDPETKNAFGHFVGKTNEWRDAGNMLSPPPALPLLAVLALAAEQMEQDEKFSANNFYGRLHQTLEMDLDADWLGESYGKILPKKFGKLPVSEYLWGSLNYWLESWDGLKGLPTAYAIAHRHVGIARSQALVRNQDRKKLHEMFDSEGLSPRSVLQPQDMLHLIDEWINREPSPAQSLKHLWDKDQNTISEIACQELEAWEGSSETTASGSTHVGSRLRIALFLRQFPQKGHDVSLVGQSRANETAQRSLQWRDQKGREIEFISDSHGVLLLDNPELFDVKSILEGRISLKQEGSDSAFERLPKRVIPLRFDTIGNYFVEADRLELAETSKVLCRSDLAVHVEHLFDQIAQTGWKCENPAEGISNDWCLFHDVRVMTGVPDFETFQQALPKHVVTDLSYLIPNASSVFVLDGGFRLTPPNTWSVSSPPEIRASGIHGSDLRLRLEPLRILGDTIPAAVDRKFADPVAIFPLSEVEGLAEGAYRLQLFNGRKQAQASTLRLRSADTPASNRNIKPGEQLGFSKEDLLNSVTSAVQNESAIITGAATSITTSSSERLKQASCTPPWLEARESQSNEGTEQPFWAHRDEPSLKIGEDELPECIELGNHVKEEVTWDSATNRWKRFIPDGSHYRQGTGIFRCKNCGLQERLPVAYYGGRHKKFKKRQRTSSAPIFNVKFLPEISHPESGIELADLALDALSFQQSGSDSELRRIVAQVDPSPIAIDSFVRGLQNLGHIEILDDPSTSDTRIWQIATPVLAGLPNTGEFILAGFRNGSLVEKLQEWVEPGGSVTQNLQLEDERSLGPSAIRVSGIDASELRGIASELPNENRDRSVQVIEDAALKLAHALPHLSQLSENFPRSKLTNTQNPQKWDSRTALWTPVNSVHTAGFFAVKNFTSTYFRRTSQDVDDTNIQRMDPRMLKHIAALESKTSLIGYDEKTSSIYVPIGADLPGLFGRCAVLASGLLPRIQNGVLQYSNVPPDLAAILKTKLES